MFFLGDRLSGLIDFYFACNDALAYDVAVCLNAWCFENDHVVQHHQGTGAAARLRGACARSTPAERAAMPLLARGAALRFLLTRAYDWLNTPTGCARQPQGPASSTCAGCASTSGVRSIAEYGLEETCDERSKPRVVIYTDGACSGNPGPGGWGAILI